MTAHVMPVPADNAGHNTVPTNSNTAGHNMPPPRRTNNPKVMPPPRRTIKPKVPIKRTNNPKKSTLPSIPDPNSYEAGARTGDNGTNVKTPNKNVLDLTEQGLDAETAADLLFYEIGGIELSNMLSYGTVKGINQNFRVISNIEELQSGYDPTRLLSEQAPGTGGVKEFTIDLFEKLLDPESGFIRIERESDLTNMINLVIELDNIDQNEELELQVVVSGKIIEIL